MTNVRHLSREIFVNHICHDPWNVFFILRVANYDGNFVQQVIQLTRSSCLTPHSFSVFVVFCLVAPHGEERGQGLVALP